jgi:Fe-S-cluster containining protein
MKAQDKRKRQLRVLRQHADVIYSQTDIAVKKSCAAEAVEVTCTRGCNACCRMQTLVYMPEAVAIVDRYPKLVAQKIDELAAHARIVEKLCAKYNNESTRYENEIAQDWWALQLACPFVLKNGDCGVYEMRPVVCRTHLVADDPERCKKVPAVYIDHVVVNGLRKWAHDALSAVWLDTMDTHVLPLGSLQKMVLVAYRQSQR